MLRRQFLGGAAAAAMGLGAPGDTPNVIVIYADDLGYGDLGCYGSKLSTPNLDRMAREGMKFTHAMSANPVCSPSRAALLTGRYPTRVGVPRVLFPADRTGLNADEKTMAMMLKEKGYKTKCIGKWHLGHTAPNLPTFKGFDEYFGIPYSNDMSPRWLMRNTEVLEQNVALEDLIPRYTDEAVKFIEKEKDGPFYLYMPHTYPHIPLGASKKFRGTSEFGLYGDVIAELDWSVGQIFETLRRLKLDKKTLVIFSSDNGPWYEGSPGHLRGRKGSTLEGGMREPFIAWMPGKVAAGKTCASLISMMDIVPTVAKLAGAKLGANPVDGVDIWPLLSGQRPTLEREVLLYFDFVHLQCARLGKYKLHLARYNSQVYSPPPQSGRINLPLKRPELYDVVADPDESYDIAEKHPEIVADIRKRAEKLLEGFPAEIRKAYAETMATSVADTPAGNFPRKAAQ